MALKDLYPDWLSIQAENEANAFNQWKAANPDLVSQYSPFDLQLRYQEAGLHDPGVGPNGITPTGLTDGNWLKSLGYFGIDTDAKEFAKAQGVSPESIMGWAYGPGSFETGFGSSPDDLATQYYKPTDLAGWRAQYGVREIPFHDTKDFWGKYGGAIMGSLVGGAALAGVGGAGGAVGSSAGAGSFGAGIGTEMGLGGIGLDAAASSAAGYGTAGLTGGSGMSFFDDILDLPFDVGDNLVNNPDLFGTNYEDLVRGLGDMESGFSNETRQALLDQGYDITKLSPVGSGLGNDWLKKLTNLLPNGSGSDLGGLLKGLGGLGSDLFGNVASLAPSLAAINYARNLGSPDISRLESAYSQVDPNALALPYDIQTGKGRDALTSSLTQRGVMGSSFANQDLSSYDTLRGLGRSSLLTQGAGQQASIASQILAAQTAAQKQKLDLYGRSLLALSGGLNPARSGAF